MLKDGHYTKVAEFNIDIIIIHYKDQNFIFQTLTVRTMAIFAKIAHKVQRIWHALQQKK